MLIKIRTSADLPYSEVTPEALYRSRRDFIRTTAAGAIGAIAATVVGCGPDPEAAGQGRWPQKRR
jgi:hypothetical protein